VSKLLRAPAVIVVSLALTLGLGAMASAKSVTKAGDPITNKAGQTFKVVAHRGGASQWPENSLEAFTGAANADYDGVETDLSFTSDGVAVLSHNDKLPSRCSQTGQSIHKMTLAEVQTVRCADLSGALTVPIPTFAQLTEILQSHPAMWLTLDIKSYSGQSAAGKRSYATRGAALIKKYGLLNRTRFLSYYWNQAVQAIHKVASKAYVIAYQSNGFDYDLVRLAAKVGASAYGTEVKYTGVNLAKFVRANHLDLVTWNISGASSQGQAMAIYYGPKTYWFLTDSPGSKTSSLVNGSIKLNWTAADQVTALATPITVSQATYQANKNQYPKVLGVAVPKENLAALKTVNLAITVAKGSTKNYGYFAAASSPSSSRIKVALPAAGGTVNVSVPLGDGGKLRVRTAKKSKLTIAVLSYTNEIYS
jgi:glycerophosphoryl diester phosphodiesterase